MLGVFATILAVESRRPMAESLERTCTDHGLQTKLSIKDVHADFNDAFFRFRELLEFATLQYGDWHLFLEDDQELTPEFWWNLERLMEVGHKAHVDVWYLSNRNIEVGQLGYLDEFRVNRILSWAPGSHGLLYRKSHAQRILDTVTSPMPIDFAFWKTMDPHRHRHFQVCRPVLAIHRGAQSSLYSYDNLHHIDQHPLAI